MIRILFFPIIFLISCCDCDTLHYPLCEGLSDNIEYNTETIDRKVLIIGIDGIRSDVIQDTISPFLYNLSINNNVYYTPSHQVEEYTYSGPNWSSILTGVHWIKHNVSDNAFSNTNYDEYPTFFDYIERVNESINTASIVNWTPINNHILLDVVDYAPLEPLSDLDVFELTQNILLNNDPMSGDVIFLHFDELDGAGHSYGFSMYSDEYTSTLNVIDGYVGSLFSIIEEKRSNGEDWMVFIISDHGGDGTGHGDYNNPYINQTVFFAEHPNIQFLDNYISSMPDLAPTVLSFLGIYNEKFYCKTDGVSLINYDVLVYE